MAVVSLELFKVHVRADDFSDDDEYLQSLLDAAEAHIIRETHRSAEELSELGEEGFPAPLVQAIMLLAAHWYNQREAVSTAQMHAVPMGVQSLVKPYRKLS